MSAAPTSPVVDERRPTDTELLDWLEDAARRSPTGISFDWVPSVEGEPTGFRFMRRHFVGVPARTLREAVRRARMQVIS